MKLKSKLITITKEAIRFFKVMIVGFILIFAMLIIKYKPVYEVKIADETLGYISDKEEFEQKIQELLKKDEANLEDVSLSKKPEYERKLVTRRKETNEDEILSKIDEEKIKTYKFYSVCLNDEKTVYVNTLEDAVSLVDRIKSQYEGKGLELDFVITKNYTDNIEEVKTDTVEVAKNSVGKELNALIKQKQKQRKKTYTTTNVYTKINEAIKINGIDLAVLPVSGAISSRYGEMSSIRSGAHTGLDIVCAKGTPIRAVAGGTVIYTAWYSAYGKLVEIDHGNGVQTWYAHCDSFDVNVGDVVSAGDVIAKSGATGNVTGPHLHLEIRINGTPVNPQLYLYK